MPSKSRNNRKSKASKKSSTKVAEPVEQVAEPVEQVVQQVEAPAKKSKSRSRKSAPVAEPVVEQTAPVAEPVEQVAAPAKARKTRAPKRKVVEQTETEVQVTEALTEVATETETVGGRRVRSFKVMLPESENYEGRFTGLTPYQAANKALSSYYKACKKNGTTALSELEFSIRESTRSSAHKVYTYRGARVPLDTPVEYTIKQQDGTERVITKEYKNRLTKVKKAELTSESA